MVKHREGGDPLVASRKAPGQTEYDAITLERGVTHDVMFEQWANKVWNFGSGLGAEVSLKDFRKDVILEFYNEAGQLAIAYKIIAAGFREFKALPELDAGANAMRSPSRPSSWRTKAGSGTTTWSSRPNPRSSNRRRSIRVRRLGDVGASRTGRSLPGAGGRGRAGAGDAGVGRAGPSRSARRAPVGARDVRILALRSANSGRRIALASHQSGLRRAGRADRHRPGSLG